MDASVALLGGNEFRTGCENLDLALIESIQMDNPKVVIVPTAAKKKPDLAVSNGVTYFRQLGITAYGLPILDQDDANDESLIDQLHDASIVYFTGGHPAHILHALQGSKLVDYLRYLKPKGTIVAGSSAGAMVLGSIMWLRESRKWVNGLDIAQGIAVLPHHEEGDPGTISQWLDKTQVPKHVSVFGIDSMTGCLSTPKGWKIIGPGSVTIYQNGSWQTLWADQIKPYIND